MDEEEKLKAEEYKSTWCYSFLKLVHHNLDRTAILLAIINISLGVFLAVFEWYWILIWFCYLALFICIYFMFEARKQSNRKSKATENEEDDEDARSGKLNSSSVNNCNGVGRLSTPRVLNKSYAQKRKLDDLVARFVLHYNFYFNQEKISRL